MSETVALGTWFVGLVLWYGIRHPYQRRARKIGTARNERDLEERLLLGFTVLTLLVLPALYAGSEVFHAYDYAPFPGQQWLGLLLLLGFLLLFYRSHADLGRNWSVTLEIRERHSLITQGVYTNVRCPMYTAFLLWAAAQALLINNSIIGPASLVSIGLLLLRRMPREERMMRETFSAMPIATTCPGRSACCPASTEASTQAPARDREPPCQRDERRRGSHQ